MKFLKLNELLDKFADVSRTVAFSMSGRVVVVVKGVESVAASNSATGSSPTNHLIVSSLPRFTASHVRVSVPGHCSPDSSNNPILELS